MGARSLARDVIAGRFKSARARLRTNCASSELQNGLVAQSSEPTAHNDLGPGSNPGGEPTCHGPSRIVLRQTKGFGLCIHDAEPRFDSGDRFDCVCSTLSDLKKHVLELLARSAYGHYYYIQADAALRFKLKIMTPPTLSEAELDSIRVEFQKIVRAVARKQEPYIKKIQNEELKIKQEFLEARGFRLQGRELYVNYSWVIKLIFIYFIKT